MTTAPAPPREGAARAPSGVLLVGCVGAGGRTRGPLAEALLEASHAPTGVEDLLLAGVEGVASRADLDGQLTGRGRAAGLEGVAAATGHGGDVVGRVDVGLHIASSAEVSWSFWWWKRLRPADIPAAQRGSADQSPRSGDQPASGVLVLVRAQRRLLDLHEELDV